MVMAMVWFVNTVGLNEDLIRRSMLNIKERKQEQMEEKHYKGHGLFQRQE